MPKGSQRPCGLKSFNKRVQGSAKGLSTSPPSFLCYYQLLAQYVTYVKRNSSINPPPSAVGKVLHREAEPLDTEPCADDVCRRQKGPLLRCQDNATAAIVKSQGYCVVDFSAGFAKARTVQSTRRAHTPAQTHKDDREM